MRTTRRGPVRFELHGDRDPVPSPWLDRAAWIVIALFGALIMWIVLGVHHVGNYATESDFYGGYAEGARLVRRGVLNPERYGVVGPGYDVALAIIGLGVGDLFTAGKLISALSALATLVLWHRIVRKLLEPGAAAWTVFLLAANPVFFQHAYSATTDMMALALQAAAVHCLVAGGFWRMGVGAGAWIGLASLTRYNSIALVPAGVAIILGSRAPEQPPRLVRSTFRNRAGTAAGLLLGVAVVCAPWILHSMGSGYVPGRLLFGQYDFYSNPDVSRNVQDSLGVQSGDVVPQHKSLVALAREDPGRLMVRSSPRFPIICSVTRGTCWAGPWRR